MRYLVAFVVVLSLGMFSLGCGGGDEKPKKDPAKPAAGEKDNGGKTENGGKTDPAP